MKTFLKFIFKNTKRINYFIEIINKILSLHQIKFIRNLNDIFFKQVQTVNGYRKKGDKQ